MSSESNATLYIVREAHSLEWLPLVTKHDALLLVEDGVYRQPEQLPHHSELFVLKADAQAREVKSSGHLIDHGEWVTLSLKFAQVVRL